MKKTFRTVRQLTRKEIEELRLTVLYNDEEFFYDSVEEITDDVLFDIFVDTKFKYSDFDCNRAKQTVRVVA